MKNIRMAGGTNLELRFEAFNMWNWHTFQGGGEFGEQPFNTDIASPNFGTWTGAVTQRVSCSWGSASSSRVRVSGRMGVVFRRGGARRPSLSGSHGCCPSAHLRCCSSCCCALPRPSTHKTCRRPLAARFSEGVAALKAGELDAAEAAFRDVLAGGGNRAFVHHNLGIVHQQREHHAEALAEFRAASPARSGVRPGAAACGDAACSRSGGPTRRWPSSSVRSASCLARLSPALQLAHACELAGNAPLPGARDARARRPRAVGPRAAVPPREGVPAAVAVVLRTDSRRQPPLGPPERGARPRVPGAGTARSGASRVSAGGRA